MSFPVFSQNYFDHILESKVSKESTKSFKYVLMSQVIYAIFLPVFYLFAGLASLAAGWRSNCYIKCYISAYLSNETAIRYFSWRQKH